MRFRKYGLVAILAAALVFGLLSSFVVFAQDDVIRVDTELVAFEVTVSDAAGNPVKGLSAEDFTVIEDGRERTPDFFQPIVRSGSGRPLSIVFALDVSGSMTEKELDDLKEAMERFVGKLADYNSYFAVMTFAMDVKKIQGFTNRPEKLSRSFRNLARNRDGLSTHAYDAIDDAVRLLARRSPARIRNQVPKRAVIVITDGFPVGDIVSPSTVVERANAAEVSLFSLILPSYSRLQGSGRPLLTPLEASGVVERTGGISLYANQRSFDPLFAKLAEEITSSYAIAFYPREADRDGKFHGVKITTKKGRIVKQNRPGYVLVGK
jgi:VWFA-related protein